MSNVAIVRKYFETFFSGPARHAEVREWLTDDLTFRDPLMSAKSADDYVSRLKTFGDVLDLHAELVDVVGEADRVAALVDFRGPSGPMRYAQWFRFRGRRIAGLEVIYDPRPFLRRATPQGARRQPAALTAGSPSCRGRYGPGERWHRALRPRPFEGGGPPQPD